jgi:hypothetical protein
MSSHNIAYNADRIRFCSICNKVFEIGNVERSVDEKYIRKYCIGCDPTTQTKLCPECGCSITWTSNCQRIQCTTCKIYFCSIHLRTEQSIKDNIIKLRKNDPDGILKKYETSQWSLDNEWETCHNVGDGLFIYRCTDCVKAGTLYKSDETKYMDKINTNKITYEFEPFKVRYDTNINIKMPPKPNTSASGAINEFIFGDIGDDDDDIGTMMYRDDDDDIGDDGSYEFGLFD